MSHPQFRNPTPPENAAQARAYYWNAMMAKNAPGLLALQKEIREFCTLAKLMKRAERTAGYKKIFSNIQNLIADNAKNYVETFLQNYWAWQVKDHLKLNMLPEDEYKMAVLQVIQKNTAVKKPAKRKSEKAKARKKKHGTHG